MGQPDDVPHSPDSAEEELDRDPTEIGPHEQGISLSPEFKGGVLSLVGMTLLMCNPFILPIAWGMAFFGGVLMGYGARLARGCTSGQALSGGAVLSVGSWVFMFAVFGGAYGLAYFVRKFWN